ncbi:MAG: hydrogenase [Desulfobacteraceae bacterium]|nr:MAG: hydrogenase [Desulfobacteraceae bacterium]
MQVLQEILVIVLILLNFRLLGTSRLGACVQTVALQAPVIGLLPLLVPGGPDRWIVAMVVAATVVKGLVLPALVRRALRETGVVRELEPLLGYTFSILTGTGLLVLSYLAGRSLQLPMGGAAQLLVPGTLFTMLTGLFLIVARRKAITQVLGFLVLENGIYLFGVAFAVHEPWLVQTGVLLDVFAAVFVMGITIHQINREFDHIDTDRLSSTKD